MRMYGVVLWSALAAIPGAAALHAQAPVMPGTAGETLSGKKIVLADAVRGHAVVLVAGFSHDAGIACGDWMKAIRGDAALAGVDVYEIAMLEGAPGLFRGMIKSGMRKGMSSTEQERSVVLTQDDKLWEKFFAVSNGQAPQVMLLDATGNVLWHGQGKAAELEPELRNAVSSH